MKQKVIMHTMDTKRRPSEAEMGINQVEDADQARRMAENEKPIRDLAREGEPDQENKKLMDEIAARRAEDLENIQRVREKLGLPQVAAEPFQEATSPAPQAPSEQESRSATVEKIEHQEEEDDEQESLRWYEKARSKAIGFLPRIDRDMSVSVERRVVSPSDPSKKDYSTWALYFKNSNGSISWTMEIQKNDAYLNGKFESAVRKVYARQAEARGRTGKK